MVSYADLRDIDPYVFQLGEFAWHTANTELAERGRETKRAMDELANWTGEAADGAKASFTAHADRLQDSADAIFEAYKLFNEAADRIGDAKAKIADGTITDDNWRNRYPHEEIRVRDLIEKYQPAFHGAVADATRADREIAAKLRKLTAEALGLAPSGGDTTSAAKSIPKPGTAPAEVQRWWDSLSPMEQESLLFSRAAELGMLDGLPAVARDRANRFRLVEEKAELAADKERLEAKGANLTNEEGQWLQQINDKLAGIETIEDRLHDPDKPQAYLLAIDGNDNGRAVIASGNPDTATNVATYVPGTGANLHGSGWPHGPLGPHGARRRSGRFPVDIGDHLGRLRRAAELLRRGQHGLRRQREGRSGPVPGRAACLARGSAIAQHGAGPQLWFDGDRPHASGEGLDADALVFVGSPGVGVNNVSELNFPADQVYATVAENDIIHLANMENPEDVHEMDPTDPDFGAQVFASNEGTAGPIYQGGYSVEAHSEYWGRYNTSLESMGMIIAGEQPR